MTIRRTLALSLLAIVPAWPASGQDSSLQRLLQEGLAANSDLAATRVAGRQAEARWSASEAGRLPTVGLDARYSLAEGGRTFDVPVGDLLNPAYETLNDLVGSSRFPTVANQRFRLLRDREQDTRLHVTQVLWNPSVAADVRSKRSMVDAARAGTDATRRALVRDIRVAYYTYANATRAESILEAALELVVENERAQTASWHASMVTRDAVHRARSERLDVQVELERARADRRLAAARLNYLVRREPRADVELSPEDLVLPTWASAGQDGTMAPPTLGSARVDELAERAATERSELRQLDYAIAAAEAGMDATRGTLRPSLALAVDAGIQGREYGFGTDERYVLASLVMSWNVTPWSAESSRVQEATLEVERLRHERDDAAAQIRLEVESAALDARVAIANLPLLRERVEAAEAAFRVVVRRRDEGLVSPVEFLDGRADLTSAQLAESIGEATALIRLAELDFASGADPGEIPTAPRDGRRP